MNLLQIKNLIASDEYEFLKSNEHLGGRIIMLGLGGSHAYGTNIETSDLDVRGCALNRKKFLRISIMNSLLMKRQTLQFMHSTN